MRLSLLLAALVVPARALDWDKDPVAQAAAALPPRSAVVRVFLARPPEPPGLEAAVAGFLEDVLVRRDHDRALGALSEGVDDLRLAPEQVLAQSQGPRPTLPVPLSRDEALRQWRLALMHLDDHYLRGAFPRPPASLEQALRPVSVGSAFVAELRESFAGKRRPFAPEPLGPLFLSYRASSVEDLAWTGWVGESLKRALPERLARTGYAFRVVLAVTTEPADRPVQLATLWAAEPGGWRLWGLFPNDPFLPEKP